MRATLAIREAKAALVTGLLALLITACGRPAPAEPNYEVTRNTLPMILAPGWVTGTVWPTEAVVALNSISARETSLVKGNVTVITAGVGTFLTGTSELSMAANAEIDGNVRADSIDMVASGHIFGTAAYNQLTGLGTIDGTKTPSLTTPVPLTVVATSNFTAGTLAINVSSGSLTTRNAGTYGVVTLASGTRGDPTILRLNAGTFNFDSVVMGDFARLECKTTCEIRVKNRISTGSNSYIGVGGGGPAKMFMDGMKLFVEGANGASGPKGLPAAVAIGARSELKAYTFVPNGTLVFGQSATGVGKFVAKDVDIGVDVELMSGTSAHRVLLDHYVVGPTWPTELFIALNSFDVLSSTEVTGDAAVIQDGSGSFLNTSEAVIGTNARITGNLRADRVDLKTGSAITGMLGYNTRLGTGSAGTTSTPLPLPLDVRVPVFPVVTTGSSNLTVPARVDQTLAPGRYRDVILTAGISTDRTVLTLTGGVYEMRILTLSNYSSIVCATACELRIKNRINPGEYVQLGPTTGLDVSQVKVFIFGKSSSPGSTPFQASFGINSTVEAFFFVPRGTLEVKSGVTLRGRFIARDIRLGSSVESEQTGVTLLAPAIQQQPQSITVTRGQSATFHVSATGSDITFQWNRNGMPIAGATSGSYTLPVTALSDDGATFTVTVSNGVGSLTSDVASLGVNFCDDITHPPVATSCGVGACARTGIRSCVDGSVVDSCSAGAPAAADATCNNIDDDCNGAVDDDYVSLPTTCALGACASAGLTSCVGGVVQDSCVSTVPAPDDSNCNGIDDDCNGQVDEDFVSYPTTCGDGVCRRTGMVTCVGGAAQDSCEPAEPNGDEDSDTSCNGIDEDCDGEADDDYNSVATSCGVGACRANGATDCVAGQVINSCQAGTNAPNDATCNGVDDDCNGQIDEDYVPTPSTCGVGACGRTGTFTCTSGVLQNSCTPAAPAANDVSCNNIDDDCNGSVDEDYVSLVTTCGTGTCTTSGATSCVNGNEQDSCDVTGNACDLPTMVAIAGGGQHSCAVLEDTQVTCWGANSDGQLGNGGSSEAAKPVLVSNLNNVLEIVTGQSHSCAVRDNGTVRCWGANGSGQLGNGSNASANVPVPVIALTDATQLAAGLAHTCALRATGEVACWGDNANGQLGNGSRVAATTPVMVTELTDAVDITAGYGHSCALRATGEVVCWGANWNGQLGIDTLVDTSTPTAVLGLSDVTQIAAGVLHTCALHGAGEASCWGANTYGQLGDGSTTDAATPVAVSNVSNAAQIATGQLHTCLLRQTGEVSCWGYNGYGQLGDASLVDAATPKDVVGVLDAVQISTGDLHSCALLANDEVHCWGDGSMGQLGHGASEIMRLPSAVADLVDASQVVAGSYSTCAMRTNGQVSCWGSNSSGELGNGTFEDASAPLPVSSISDAVMIASGDAHSCAVHAAGEVSCWGYGYDGELGNGLFDDANEPVAVSGISDAIAVAAGVAHSCAVHASGDVSCWGYGGDGQLGDGLLTDSSTPVAVSGISDAIAISVGVAHSCAVRANGQVVCWGEGLYGRLGHGSANDASTPVTVSNISTAVRVSVGDYHSCALLTSGSIRCWGRNSSGQLGNGTLTAALAPETISGIHTAIAVSSGAAHTCALLLDGSMRCWGANGKGQLGDGSSARATTPIAVTGIVDATSIATGLSHSCATRAAGDVLCWGEASNGRLGNHYPWSKVPVLVDWSL